MKAYLIGNGASIPYGAPAGKDIFKQALKLCYEGWTHNPNKDKSYSSDSRFYLKQNVFELLSTMDDLRGQLALGERYSLHAGKYSMKMRRLLNPNISDDEKLNKYGEIESYLGEYRIWELFPEIVKYYNDDKLHGYGTIQQKKGNLIEYAGNFFDKMADFSLKVIYLSIKDYVRKPNYYDKFVDLINSSLEDTIIINLNYDTLLETAIKNNFQGNFEYGFGEVKYFPSESHANLKQKIKLYKPHGSFDMLYCEECKTLTISNDVPLEYSKGSHPDDRRECKNPDHENSRNLDNFFIPYTYTDISPSLRYKEILEAIIEDMESELKEINEITTIGYSFSEYNGDLIDKHLKFIFEGKNIKVVGKDQNENNEICKRLAQLGLKAEDSEFDGFDDFVKQKL